MPNGIRDPKEGNNATSRRIAQAVDNRDWQKFRVSLKGISTRDKLTKLLEYHNDELKKLGALMATEQISDRDVLRQVDDIKIRIDNYLKALARGGLIDVSRNYMLDLIEGRTMIRR